MALYLSYEDTTHLDIKIGEVIEVLEEAHMLLASRKGVYNPRVRLVYPPTFWSRRWAPLETEFENPSCYNFRDGRGAESWWDKSVEIVDIMLNRKPGRTSEDEIIAYLNSGCGIYDVAVASYVFKRPREQGLGTLLPP